MRLDKFLCEANLGTRSQVKDLIRRGAVTVNDVSVKGAETRVDEETDIVCVQGRPVHYQKFFYYMLNKPPGIVSATRDKLSATVMELLRPEHRRSDLFPAGRLDKDTEGFLLLTNDGELAHRLLSPKKHVDKTYRVSIDHGLSEEDIQRLEQGVDIGEDCPTLPAKVQQLEETVILLTIQEGKFHQVKRMLMAVDNSVTALKRISFGGITLDDTLKPGEYRELTKEEVKILYGT
ncbi:MAG: rRNA pseudouridine synthase [Acetatifactor sp.]|nr:rRNA pseudouridine synthase [Acetatifactor sp.]